MRIQLDASENCIIRNCKLDHCVINLKAGKCYNNFFINNILDGVSSIPKFNGGGNQYINNINAM